MILTLPPSVSLPARAMRLDALLKTMSTQTGGIYRASEPMAGRIVLVTGPARPVAAVQTDLATATWGAWRRVGNEWLLDEDHEGVRGRDRARIVRRIASVQGSLNAMASKVGAPFDATAAKALGRDLDRLDAKFKDGGGYAAFQAGADAIPSLVALRRVVASFTPEALAALPDGRLVFSDRPNRLQRPLPAVASTAIRDLEKAQNLWAATYVPTDENGNGRSLMDPRTFPDAVPPGGLRLILEAQVSRYSIGFQAWFVDRTLRVRQFAQTQMDATSSPPPATAPEVDPKEKPLPLGEDAAAYERALGGGADPRMRSMLLRPELHEPLDFYPAEVCRAIARARHAAVTIWLDDNLLAFAMKGYHRADPKRDNTASEWIRQLWIRAYNAVPGDGAIVFRPRGAATNVDRARLGALLCATDAAGCPPLDDLADYAVATPADQDSLPMIAGESLDAILPGSQKTIGVDWNTLRLWGTFSRVQRREFLKGATVRFDTLQPLQRDRLVAAILKADRNEIQRSSEGRPFITLDDEPTELLADGFGIAGGVTGTLAVEDGILPRTSEEEGVYTTSVTPWTLAYGTIQRERHPDQEANDGLPRSLAGPYVPGRLLTFGLRVPLSPTLAWIKSGQYGEFNLRARPKPLAAMPATFLATYNDALERLRKGASNG